MVKMFNCLNFNKKIDKLCAQVERLQLNSVDQLTDNNQRELDSSTDEVSPTNRNETSSQQSEFSIKDLIANQNSLSNDVKEIKLTLTSIMLIQTKLLDHLTRLETIKSNQETPKVGTQQDEEQKQIEKENVQPATIKTEKVTIKKGKKRNPLSDVSTTQLNSEPNMTLPISKSKRESTSGQDPNETITFGMTLRPRPKRNYRY